MTNTTAASTAALRPRSLDLRTALQLDAAVTGLNGAAYLVAAPLLQDVLGVPAGPLRGVGVFLLGFSAAVAVVGTRPALSTRAVRAVIALNLLWVLESAAAAALGWGTPTPVGTGWILLQAAVVGGFAALQWSGLRSRARS